MNDSIHDFNLYDHLNDYGVGINIKFGLIYRITDWLRIGAAIHSPTFYHVNRSYQRDSIRFIQWQYVPCDIISPISNFTYNLQTPAHYIGSAAFIIGKIWAYRC